MRQSYRNGELVNIDLGKPPGEIKGHEQAFQRPCAIIRSFSNLSLVIIIPLTTKQPQYGLYTIVKIPKGSGGLNEDSYALCHQIRTVSFDRILNKIGQLENKDFLKIKTVLLDTLEL